MRQVETRLHRELAPTRLWTFGGTFPGPTFEMRSGHGAWIEWVNELPERHFLPIDHTLHGAEADKPEVRTVVHVHGAKVRPRATATRRIGIRAGKARRTTTRIARKRPRSGI